MFAVCSCCSSIRSLEQLKTTDRRLSDWTTQRRFEFGSPNPPCSMCTASTCVCGCVKQSAYTYTKPSFHCSGSSCSPAVIVGLSCFCFCYCFCFFVFLCSVAFIFMHVFIASFWDFVYLLLVVIRLLLVVFCYWPCRILPLNYLCAKYESQKRIKQNQQQQQ